MIIRGPGLFPFTLIVHAGVIFTHYASMLNEIRRIYGRDCLSSEVIVPIIDGCKPEILADIIVDRLIGKTPVIGIRANVICAAKTITWRLGLLFAMLSARGDEVSSASVTDCIRLIRKLFPQTSMFKFKTPSIDVVEKLLEGVTDTEDAEFHAKVTRALSAFD